MDPLGAQRHHPDSVTVLRRFLPDRRLPALVRLFPVVQYRNRCGQCLPYGILIPDVHGNRPRIQRIILSRIGAGINQGKRCLRGRHFQRHDSRYGRRAVFPDQRHRHLVAPGRNTGFEHGIPVPGLHRNPDHRPLRAVAAQGNHDLARFRCAPGSADPFPGNDFRCGDRRRNQAGNHLSDRYGRLRCPAVHFRHQAPLSLRNRDSVPGTVPVQGVVSCGNRPVRRHNGNLLPVFVQDPDTAGAVLRRGHCNHCCVSGQYFPAGNVNPHFRCLRPRRAETGYRNQYRRQQCQDPQPPHR